MGGSTTTGTTCLTLPLVQVDLWTLLRAGTDPQFLLLRKASGRMGEPPTLGGGQGPMGAAHGSYRPLPLGDAHTLSWSRWGRAAEYHRQPVTLRPTGEASVCTICSGCVMNNRFSGLHGSVLQSVDEKNDTAGPAGKVDLASPAA